MKRRGSIQTNLTGRRVRLRNDDDARIEAATAARRGGTGPTPEEAAAMTADRWWPVMGRPPLADLRGVEGEVVSVYLDPDGEPKYTVAFAGQLIDLYGTYFRLLGAEEKA